MSFAPKSEHLRWAGLVASAAFSFRSLILMPSKNLVGPTIRRLRVERDLTQDALAARCQLAGWDLSRATLSKIEAGLRRINDAEIYKMAEVLEVDLIDLFPAKIDDLEGVLRHSQAD